MQVNRIQSNNPTFGMALYMKNAQVLRKCLGNKFAKTLEEARPGLKNLAKDVDIFIKPCRFANNPFMPLDHISITVKEKNITLKDKLMSLFGNRPPYKEGTFIDPNFLHNKDDIIKQTIILKNNLLNWIGE